MLNKEEISNFLEEQKFSIIDENSKTVRYSDSQVTVFLKQNTKRQPLVAHPDLQDRYQSLASIKGIECAQPMRFYHNSTMRAFPERTNTGLGKTKYGLAFGFEHKKALQTFLNAIRSKRRSTLIGDLFDVQKSDISETERQVLLQARIGQGQFRASLIEEFGGKCPVTGVTIPELLRASHIVPWAKCHSASERLNPQNGILLATNVDALFDKGFITFDEAGILRVSRFVDPQTIKSFGIVGPIQIDLRTSLRRKNMSYHRRAVFLS